MSSDCTDPKSTRNGRSLEEIKAEARAYALSGGGARKKRKVTPVPVAGPRYPMWPAPSEVPQLVQTAPLLSSTIVGTIGSHSASIGNSHHDQLSSHPSNEMAEGPIQSPMPPDRLQSPSNMTATLGPTVLTALHQQCRPLPYSGAYSIHSTYSRNKLPNLDDFDEDYAQFMKVLNLDPNFDLDNAPALLDDDEEEFQLEEGEEEEDDDDAEDNDSPGFHSASSPMTSHINETASPHVSNDAPSVDIVGSPLPALESDFYRELDEELCWLEEEDMEAAVATLLDYPPANSNERPLSPMIRNGSISDFNCEPIEVDSDHSNPVASASDRQVRTEEKSSVTDCNPTMEGFTDARSNLYSVYAAGERDTVSFVEQMSLPTRAHHRTVATAQQHQQLKELLEKHHQLLLQQAVLAVRAAHQQRNRRGAGGTSLDQEKSLEFLFGTETPDDLAEVLDGAVEMLQDLDQNRKDAIRHHIQFESSGEISTMRTAGDPPRNRSLFPDLRIGDTYFDGSGTRTRRLTRSQFSKTLQEQGEVQRRTIFDIRGLSNLKSSFATIDGSVDGMSTGSESILNMDSNTLACEILLRQSGGVVDLDMIPGRRDVSLNFVDTKEILGEQFEPPCSYAQQVFLRKNRNLFTAGEDNLVLRGVNLYGEKQWSLIGDRYLPERSMHIISQRYAKLCFLLYTAHGIKIDANGNFAEPPKCNSIDDVDETELAKLQKVDPPAILNVHRWSIEEDIVLLKAVALMGSMWAELRARLIPHRDRGHLRKRYQVLERRMKATVSRGLKRDKPMATRTQAPTSNSSNAANSIGREKVKTMNSRQLQRRALTGSAATVAATRGVAMKSSSRPVDTSTAATAKRRLSQASCSTKDAKEKTGALKPSAKTSAKRVEIGKGPASHVAAATCSTTNVAPFYHHPAYLYQPPPGYQPLPGYYPRAPYPYYSPYYPPVYADESSRVAYERLAHDHSHDSTQMAHMKAMMENETESMVASTIVTQLAKPPASPPPAPEASDSIGDSNPNAAEQATSTSKEAGAWSQADSSHKLDSSQFHSNLSHAHYIPSPGTPMERPTPLADSVQATYDWNTSPNVTMQSFAPGGSPSLYSYPEFSRNVHSLDGYDLKAVFSNAAPGAHNQTVDDPPTQKSKGAVQSDTGALLLENDMEAVSALNLLKSPDQSFRTVENRRRSPRKSAEKKSLFARVVGNVDEGEKSRRQKRKIRH